MQGRLIWLEAFQNKTKNALIISEHACEPNNIKKSQAKTNVQAINRYNTQKEQRVAQNLTQGITVTFKSTSLTS